MHVLFSDRNTNKWTYYNLQTLDSFIAHYSEVVIPFFTSINTNIVVTPVFQNRRSDISICSHDNGAIMTSNLLT